MRKIVVTLLLFISFIGYSQTNGITYQALILNPRGEQLPGVNNSNAPLANQNISLKFSIIDQNAQDEYVETVQTTTDEFGMVNLIIGTGVQTSGYASSFSNILWNANPKRLKVDLSTTELYPYYTEISNQPFTAVPFALYAVNSESTAALTGLQTTVTANAAATTAALATKENTANKSTTTTLGTSNVLFPTQNAVKTYVDSNITTVNANNTALQATVAANAAAATNAIAAVQADVNQNEADSDAADVVLQNNITTLQNTVTSNATSNANALALKEDAANKSTTISLGTSDLLFPTQNAVKTYVDNQVASATIPDANATTKGKIQLAGDLGGTAAVPTVPGLANKENTINTGTTSQYYRGDKTWQTLDKTAVGLANVDNTTDATKPISAATQTALNTKEDTANKSNTTTLGTSNVLFPTQNAVKTYVDSQVASATIPDANATTKGKIQLAGDLGGTAAVPTVPGLANKENTINTGTTSQYYRGDKTWQTLDKTAVGLANVDNTTDATKPISAATQTALNTKEDITNKSTTTTLGNSDVLFPTQNAVKTYVDNQVASATIADADATTKGKIQLAGDLAGTAAAPTVPGLALKAPLASPTFTGTVTSPIYASTPQTLTDAATIDWNPANGLNASVTLGGNRTLSFSAIPAVGSYGTLIVSQDATGGRTITLPSTSNKVLGSTSTTTIALSSAANAKDILNFYYDGTNCYWNIGQGYGTAAPAVITNLATGVSGTLPVANGGSGAATLTGYIKGNGTSAMTANASIPVADVTGAAPIASPTFTGTPIAPTATAGTNTTQIATTEFVTGAVASATITDATTIAKGKLQLAGDLAGTADAPTVPGLALKAPIASPTFTGTVTAPIFASTPQALTDAATISWNPANGLNASVTLGGNRTLSFSAIPAVGSYGTLIVSQDATGGRTITLPSTSNKVLGSTSTTTIALSSAANAKDILNFYYDGTNCYWNIGQGYGTATPAVITNLATGVSGTLPVANGGSGAATLTGYIKGNGTSAMTANASIPVADVTGAAPLASPTFTGTPAAPTATAGSNTTQIATTEFVTGAVALATITDATTTAKGKLQLAGDLAGTADAPTVPGLALKAPLASPTFTGAVTAPIYASTPQALTDAATISWNPANGLNASVTLGGNRTLSFTTTPTVGSYGTLVITQDATGGRTITLPSTANKVLGSTSTTTVTLSSAAGAKDILNFYYDGTNCYWNVGQGYGTAATVASTNLTSSVSGTLPIANGGTGSTTQNFVDLTTNQSIAGNKNFNGNIGIGTTSNYGSSKLHVAGNGLVVWGGTGTLLDASGNNHGHNENVALTVDGKANNDILQLRNTAPNTLLVVDKDGNMGIGNTTPSQKLEVTGNIKTSGTLTAGSITYPNTHGTANQVLSTTGSGTLGWTTPSTYSLPTASASALGGVKVGTNLSIDGTGILSTIAAPIFTGAVTAPIYASTPQALTDAATISWNPANGLNASVTLGGNRTLSFSSTPAVGSYGTLVVSQDATGGRTITLPSTSNKVLGSSSTTTITLSSAANAKDILNFYYDGTNCYWNIGQGYGTAATVASTNLTSSVSGTLPVANGGTGATTKATAFDALSPMTTSGDIIYGGANGTGTRLSKGSNGSILTMENDLPTWNTSIKATPGSSYNAPVGFSFIGGDWARNTGMFSDNPDAGGSATLKFRIATSNSTANSYLEINPSKVSVLPTTASTSKTTGALTVAGGLGVDGNIYTNNLNASGTVTAGSVTYPNAHGTANQVLSTTGSGTLAWVTPVSSAASLTGTLPIANGGTGATSLTVNNVLLGNGTSALQEVAPGTSGNILTSNGTTWISSAPAASGVPYTGATQAVNLGAYDLTVNGLTVGKGRKDTGTAYQYNSAFGVSALGSFTGGTKNTALGFNALSSVTNTDQNIAIGAYAMGSTTADFQQSVAVGNQSLQYNKGSFNTALGSGALSSISLTSAATYLVGVGALALNNNSTGQNNTAVGSYALSTNTTGNNNTAIGASADVSYANLTNATAIGYNARVGTSNTIQLGNTYVTNVNTSGAITAKNYITTVPANITAATTTVLDFSTGNILKVSLGANITTLSVTNATAGTYLLEIIQGGTYTVAFPAAWKWSGGSAPTITATSGKTDIITIVYDGTTYFASAVQNF